MSSGVEYGFDGDIYKMVADCDSLLHILNKCGLLCVIRLVFTVSVGASGVESGSDDVYKTLAECDSLLHILNKRGRPCGNQAAIQAGRNVSAGRVIKDDRHIMEELKVLFYFLDFLSDLKVRVLVSGQRFTGSKLRERVSLLINQFTLKYTCGRRKLGSGGVFQLFCILLSAIRTSGNSPIEHNGRDIFTSTVHHPHSATRLSRKHTLTLLTAESEVRGLFKAKKKDYFFAQQRVKISTHWIVS